MKKELAVGAAAFIIAACSVRTEQPSAAFVPLSQLLENPGQYSGQLIRITGFEQKHPQPYYTKGQPDNYFIVNLHVDANPSSPFLDTREKRKITRRNHQSVVFEENDRFQQVTVEGIIVNSSGSEVHPYYRLEVKKREVL